MDNDIKVSVWCLCYNHQKYIEKCLQGFVMQKTNFRFQVIVHDDASTDRSPEIIRQYAEKYPDIIKPIFQTQNQYSKKVSITKNYFIPNIHGKYVAFCEGDDFWNCNIKLQTQYDLMEAVEDNSICFHFTQVVNQAGAPISGMVFPSSDKYKDLKRYVGKISNSTFLKMLLNMRCEVHVSSLMLNAEKYKKYLCDLPKYAIPLIKIGIGDAPLSMYFASCENIYFIGYPMSCYRNSHPGSYTYEMSRKMLRDAKLKTKTYISWGLCYLLFNEYTKKKYQNIIIEDNSLFSKGIVPKDLLSRIAKASSGRPEQPSGVPGPA